MAKVLNAEQRGLVARIRSNADAAMGLWQDLEKTFQPESQEARLARQVVLGMQRIRNESENTLKRGFFQDC